MSELVKKNIIVLCMHRHADHRRQKEVWDGGTTEGLGDGSPPAGSRGGAQVGGLGTKSSEAEEFLK